MKNRRIALIASMVAIQLALLFLVLELIVPRIFPISHLVYRTWGNRPTSFYPDYPQRYVTPFADVRFHSSSQGFKDVNHEIPKPNGKFRIVLLGDSYIEALAVPIEKQASRLLEKLAERSGMDVEVISIAMSGWGQAQHLSELERLGKKYQPDLVVSFFCGNDLLNNTEDPDYRLEGDQLIYQRPSEENIETTRTRLLRQTIQRTNAYSVVRAGIVALKGIFARDVEKRAAQIAAKGVFPERLGEKESEAARLNRVVGTEYQRNLFEALIRRLKKTVIEQRGRFLNVMVSSDVRSAGDDFFFLLDWVDATVNRNGVENINLHREFSDRNRVSGLLPHFNEDSHWNSVGHEWVAERLHAYLEQNFGTRLSSQGR